MPRRNFFAIVMVGAVSLVCWQATHGAKPKDEMMELYGLFVDAVEQVESHYVRPVDRRELLESALKGMLQNLDAHSSFINTSEWKQFKKQIEGKFGGIGIQVGIDAEANRLKVIAPMVGTPAYQGGILAGDIIMEIDGNSTEGMNENKAVEVLTGRPGTPVTLTVLHDGEEKTEKITLNRAIIDVPSVLGDTRKADGTWDFMYDKDDKIGYVRISSFIPNTTEELKQVLVELKDQGMRGLVLDLRDNPGGLLNAAVEISDLFIPDGRIVSTKGRNIAGKSYDGQKEGSYDDFPMIVLVNQNSASAAEIVSACLQDDKRAKVVGQRTYGKGSVQNIIELEDGNSVLKLTVATYQRPSGKNIHRFKNAKETDEWGVSPDPGFEVKVDGRDYIKWAFGRRERDSNAHARRPRNKPEKEKEKGQGQENGKAADAKPREDDPAAENGTPKPFVDLALNKAIEQVKEELKAPFAKK
jgi:carboxyl-terminal processing protease